MVEIKTTMDKKTEEEENHERILDHLEQIKSKISNRERDGAKIKKVNMKQRSSNTPTE